jgi:membrane protease YdiL (CAAX protease family)
VLLFQIGSSVVIEKILPMQWLDYYNKMMEGVMLSQELMVLNSSNTILEFSQIVLFVSIIPAICEELLFRGYLMQSIRQLNSKSFAVIVSAFLFAAIHFNPIGFLPIFAIGIFLGGLFYATGSIVPCILFHILNNLIVIISSNYGRTDGLGYSVMSLWFGIFTFVLGVIIMLIAYNKTNKAGIK